jgi:hypothetical protein
MKSILTTFLLCCVVLFSCGPSLRETGIETNATVISKYETGFGTKKKYYLQVNFFTQPDKENPTVEKPKDTNRTVDEIINDLTIDVNMGDYQTANLSVTSGEYGQYNEGDELTIYYERGNPTNAILK